jgi:hypothetical protein
LLFWEVILSVILSKKVYMYMCPLPNGFRDRAISLYSAEIVYKIAMLREKKGKALLVTGCEGP